MKYINLGLPSEILWSNENYSINDKQYFTYDEATDLPVEVPTVKHVKELIDECIWIWNEYTKGYTVTGKNGNSIFLPANGKIYEKSLFNAGICGNFWTYSLSESNPRYARNLYFDSDNIDIDYTLRKFCFAVRTIKR